MVDPVSSLAGLVRARWIGSAGKGAVMIVMVLFIQSTLDRSALNLALLGLSVVVVVALMGVLIHQGEPERRPLPVAVLTGIGTVGDAVWLLSKLLAFLV